MDFGFILDGWVKRLRVWDAARQTLAKTTDLVAREVARQAVDDATDELTRYKDEIIRGFLLVLRWISEDPAQADRLHSIFTKSVEELLPSIRHTERQRIRDLEDRVKELEVKLLALSHSPEVSCECELLESVEGKGQSPEPASCVHRYGRHAVSGTGA